MAWLAPQRRRAASKSPLTKLCRRNEARGFHMCSCSAWADRASGRKCWRRRSASKPAGPRSDPGFDRAGTDQDDRSQDRPGANAVHRVQQVRHHDRAEYPEGVFLRACVEAVGKDKAGGRFIAITDPARRWRRPRRRPFASHLPRAAEHRRRYSVLSDFGLVPAAARGSILRGCSKPRKHGALVRGRCAAGRQSAVQLGIALGVAGREGRDKVTIVASPKLVDFGAWPEQLISESTGKHGKGLIPVDAEPLGAPDVYGSDRFFIDLRTTAKRTRRTTVRSLPCGVPGTRRSADRPQIAGIYGQEFFRLELAIAVAGAVIGINPFDQPDVETSKDKTRELTAAFEKTARCRRNAGRQGGSH